MADEAETIVFTVTIVESVEEFQRKIQQLNDNIYNILLAEAVIYCSVLGVLVVSGWLYSLCRFSKSMVENITAPLENLTKLIERLLKSEDRQLPIDVGSLEHKARLGSSRQRSLTGQDLLLSEDQVVNSELDFKIKPPDPCAEDIRSVYASLEELRYIMMFTSEDVAEAGGTRALLAYSAAYTLFERSENLKGRAVSLYCISRLHFQAGRYIECLQSMKDSISLAKLMEEKSSHPQTKHFYKAWAEKRNLQMIKVMFCIAEELTLDILDDAVFYVKAALASQLLTGPTKASLYVQMALAAVLLNQLAEPLGHLEKAKELMTNFDAPDSLLDFVSYTEALYYKAVGATQNSARMFTETLERSEKLNPRTKANCIKHLYEIFEAQGLTSEELTKHHVGMNSRKDVVFLLDCSLSMEGPRIARAINGFLHLFDTALVADDRLSFITFNRFPKVVFDLTPKGKNSAFLRKAIEENKQ